MLIVGAVIVLLITGFVIGRVLPTNVSLSSLQKGNIYQFRNLRYGLSEGAVKLLWTDALEPYDLPGQEVFLSRDSGKVAGKTADVYFYFQDGKLFQTALTLKDCDEAWFNALLKDARCLYGEETVNAQDTVYKWQKEDTLLALSAPVGDQAMLIISNIEEN